MPAKFNYNYLGRRRRIKKTAAITLVVIILVLIGVAAIVRKTYNDNLKPLSPDNQEIVVTIEPGSAPSDIAAHLESKGVIRSDWAFEWYVRTHNLREELKAGTYVLMPSQSVPEIVDHLVEGKIATDLVTILPGKRLEQIRIDFIEAGFSPKEVDAALEPGQYASHPALTDKPKNASLEGYLYPESFQKTAETKLKDIIRLSLDEMQARLTPSVRQAFSEHGLSLHEAVTLASIIELEVDSPEDRAKVAQVFLKRLDIGMRLQSNATDEYAAANPDYDTYEIKGLPPGPVSNVTESSLRALAYPAQTDWLYFVSGNDCVTRFSSTDAEHEQLKSRYGVGCE